LINRVDWLRNDIISRNGQVAPFGTSTISEITDRALMVLKDLIGERKNLLQTLYYPLKRFELSYYRNQLIHLYAHESIVACCIYFHMKKSGLVRVPHNCSEYIINVDRQELLSNVMFLSQLFKLEFIFKPGKIEDNLQEAIFRLVNQSILSYDDNQPNKIKIRNQAHSTGHDPFEFNCSLLWPFIETYWLAFLSVYAIPATGWISERVWMKHTQYLGQTLYYSGDLTYFESINKETLNNALNLLIEMNVLEKGGYNEEKSNIGAIRITRTYAKCTIIEDTDNLQMDMLSELVEHIGQFRREGHNRRDRSNINKRILHIVQLSNMSQVSKL
jgi:glycerol-3-phosphate O-acyltransferase